MQSHDPKQQADHSGQTAVEAVLAIFPIDGRGSNLAQACRAAAQAARTARQKLADLNHQRSGDQLANMEFGLGLHVGEVLFGNIGVPERLEFTVAGPAANEVARIEALTKEVGHPVLASAEIVRYLDSRWESVGCHRLRGVGKPVELYAPVI